MKTIHISLMLASLLLFNACSGLKLTLKNSSVQKPSNVALFFSVETKNNFPVPGLPPEAFRIYEDDKLISPYESQQTILNPEMSVVHYTVLLLDLSASVTASGALPNLVEAASLFAERVSKNQNVAVYGFDGGAKLIPIVPTPTTNSSTIIKGLKQLDHIKISDPSTNLNGAVVESINLIKGHIAKATQPLRFGTLVVFTDGTDQAHRVSEDDMLKAIRESDINVFTIGVGGEISVDELKRMSTLGNIQADNMAQVTTTFSQVADLIAAASRKFYLLSYCSPSRAGTHTLRVEAISKEISGSLSQEFDAAGFGPSCMPDKKPIFKSTTVNMGEARIQVSNTPDEAKSQQPAQATTPAGNGSQSINEAK